MGKTSRRKGAAWELKVAKVIGEWWGGTFRRTPQSGGWHKGDGEGKGKLRGDLVQMDGPPFPFSVECKATEGWSLDTFLRDPTRSELARHLQQTWEGAEDEGKVPMLIAKRNLRPPVVFMPVDEAVACSCPMTITFPDRNGTVRHAAVILLEDLTSVAPKMFTRKKGKKP